MILPKRDETFRFVLNIAASQGLLFFISTYSFLLHREKTHKKLNIFSGYDTIWQHAPIILRLVNHKSRVKLNNLVNQCGATLYKQILPKEECGD